MKVIRSAEVPAQAAADPIFTGEVTRQPLIDQGESPQFTAGVVTFAPGARTRLHQHTHDQLLVIVYGNGILATEQEHVTRCIRETWCSSLPASGTGTVEQPSSTLSHISILVPGSKTELLD